MNIYVSNLNSTVQREDLQKKFSPYGEVTIINLIIDKITHRNRGFAFIGMPNKTAAEKAIRELDGSLLDGSSMKVKAAQSRVEGRNQTFY